MKRILAALIGFLAIAIALTACSGSDSKPGTVPVASTGGNTEVQVEGKPLDGLDVSTVTCVKAGGKINIASAPIGGGQGLAVVMTDAAEPTVDSLAMVVDGNALTVSDTAGIKVGSAKVSVDGSTYTISGDAQGADIKNPLAGQITKAFTIKVSCS